MKQEYTIPNFTSSSFSIVYDEREKILIIDDGMNQQDQLLNFILLLTLINSILNIYSIFSGELNFHLMIWSILGFTSAGLLIFKFLKKTARKKINTSDIVRLKNTDMLGRKVFSLKLRNGRSRNLFHLKNPSEIQDLKNFLSQLSIQTD